MKNLSVSFNVSMASYNKRINTLPICLKSLFEQTYVPQKILLYIDESVPINELFRNVEEYIDKGLEIISVNSNLRSHNKYFYSLQDFKDSVIITVDDDVIYEPHTFEKLIDSYKKYPNAISANRVHKIAFDKNNCIDKYINWDFEYMNSTTPSLQLFATGVGGILYPPNLMPKSTFDKELITKLVLNADDIWLKFNQIIEKIPVIWTSKQPQHPPQIEGTKYCALYNQNKYKNDMYIQALMSHYNIDIYDKIMFWK